MVEYDNEDHIIYSPMPGKPTLRPSLADRHPNIRLVGIVVASELVHYRQNSSFHHPMKAEHSRSTSTLSSVIEQVCVGFTTHSKHFPAQKVRLSASGGVLALRPRLAPAPAINLAPASPSAAIGAAKSLTLVPAP
jgi:hypothetical protein